MQKIYRNYEVDLLIKKSLERKETIQSKNGALVVYTGKYTGRSPKDKFIVDRKSIHDQINWSFNQPITGKRFNNLYKKISSYLTKKDELFIFDGFACADPKYKLHVRVISEYAYQALFSNHLLRRPTREELDRHSPQLTILSAPECKADPKIDGTKSEVFVVLDIEKMIVLIGGTKYSGEIKKAVFSVLNAILPGKNVLPMHCSANIGEDGETALFFGLSGTGKTTLSADPKRRLIGDDEHGWSSNGTFNFEGGCYAKCINLKKENEPQIWAAIRKGSLLENVVVKPDGNFDFNDASLTENTRAVYPLDFIEQAVLTGVGKHPNHIIFLTADAFGVLPPVSRLNINNAIYHFMSGYTSKLAGTERGINEPLATFSAFFGALFMPLKPLNYAMLLRKYLLKYKTKVYLVNTGWVGGPYGIGKRISIKDTRGIIDAILNNKLDREEYRHNALFNLDIPLNVPGTDTKILNSRNLWPNKKEYDTKAESLAKLFVKNFDKFQDIPDQIRKAGPKI